jgi:hypothetical protein
MQYVNAIFTRVETNKSNEAIMFLYIKIQCGHFTKNEISSEVFYRRSGHLKPRNAELANGQVSCSKISF